MSFASQVKDELAKVMSQGRHCQIAELYGILLFSSSVLVSARGEYRIKIASENGAMVRKMYALLKKCFHIKPQVSVREGRKERMYLLAVTDHAEAFDILQSVKFIDHNGELVSDAEPDNSVLLQKECCRKSFLRGAYLASGAMSNPESSNHLEIVCGFDERADQVKGILENIGIKVKISSRKGNKLVYIKEGDAISDFLGSVGAVRSLMEFENLRILKEMRNNINRKVNCETANISKTVSASVRQLEDIDIIEENIGLKNLPVSLYEMALIRRQYPDLPLKELGEKMEPPLGKSGINHRMRKLSELAEKYR